MSDNHLDADAYRRHAPRLLALAAALVGPADAGDVVSAAVTRLLANGSGTPIENLEAYLTRAVVNETRSFKRSAARRSVRNGQWVESGARHLRADQTIGDSELMDALGRLSLRQRAVVFLAYWEDLTPDGIATQLGISEGSVRKHLARARATLRAELTEEHAR